MKNKILLLITIIVTLSSSIHVFALDQENFNYYINKNGVSLTQSCVQLYD